MTTDSIRFSQLPAVGTELAGGTFCGVLTRPDGQHCALVLLTEMHEERLTWKAALAWAKKVGGELPSRPAAALLFSLAPEKLEPCWHWTSEELDASSAWRCYFDDGYQYYNDKSYEGRAVAVRTIPLEA